MSFKFDYLVGLGFSKMKQNRNIFLSLLVLTILFNFFGLIAQAFFATLLLTTIILLVIFLVTGIVSYFINLPLKRLQERYINLFKQMNFSSTNGAYPIYIGEDETEFLKLLMFHSQIPLKEWLKRKPLIETHFNCEIAKITNAPTNNNLVYLHMVKNSLPTNIGWETDYIITDKNILSVGIGYNGLMIIDLNKTPHSFIAGETGSGKSNILKCLIYQCIIKDHEVKLIDFKRGVSFVDFDKMITVYSDYEEIIVVLENLVKETSQRLDLLRKNKVEEMEEYNNLSATSKPLKRITVFIDELAELVRSSNKETNKEIIGCLETLTRISRATGINLIMGIQRPDATVINGQIKNNVSMRICGRFVDPEPSRIMLGNNMATKLPKIRGRFILKDDELSEFQSFYITRDCMVSLNRAYIDTVPTNMTEPIPTDMTEMKEPEEPKKIQKHDTSIDFNFDDIEL